MKWLKGADTAALILWVLAGVVLPVSVLLGAGTVWLWQQGLLIWFVLGWAAITVVAWLSWRLWARRAEARVRQALQALEADASPADDIGDIQSDPQANSRLIGRADGGTDTGTEQASTLPEALAARPDWSAQDRVIWTRVAQRIDQNQPEVIDWRALPDAALHILGLVASEYHPGSREAMWRFTLPEALLVVSVASARYRELVQSHVPFADRIALGTLVSVYRQQDRISRGWGYANTARRVFRLANPVGAIAGELRDFLTNQLVDRVSHTLQHSLHRLLLQEIAQVSIDLYSGRLKVSDEELAHYESTSVALDAERTPDQPEALRVVLLGQVSAGKSSLINALGEQRAAETDRLPTTHRLTVHQLSTPDGHRWHLVDTPGVDSPGVDSPGVDSPGVDSPGVDSPGLGAPNDSGEQLNEMLVEESFQADLLLWVVRANQPARAPDQALIDQVEQAFAEHPERRKPPELLVMTHVDRLPPPGSWQPPYSLADAQGKGATMREALAAIRQQLQLPESVPCLPVSLAEEADPWNLDTLSATLESLAEEAGQAQMNRRRVASGQDQPGWRARGQQIRNLGRSAVRPFLKS